MRVKAKCLIVISLGVFFRRETIQMPCMQEFLLSTSWFTSTSAEFKTQHRNIATMSCYSYQVVGLLNIQNMLVNEHMSRAVYNI